MAKQRKPYRKHSKPDLSRAVIYARVSSKEQDREGFSIPAQLKLLNDYAITNGLTVAKEFVDVETAKASGRTSFNDMLRYLRKHPRIVTVLVEKTDRLYRNLKDWVTVDELGLEIHLVKEGAVLSAESRSSEKFLHGIKVLMAKNYIDNLSEEVRKGMTEKAAQGFWPSAAPIGYLNVVADNGRKVIIPDPRFAPLIENLFVWYATGQHTLETVTEKARKVGLIYPRSGIKITPAGVHRILRKRIYTGDFDWDGHRYKGNHEALVDMDLWNKVQDVLDGRFGAKLRTGPRDLRFSGVLTCGHCGCAVVGEVKKGKYIYYHCTGYKGKCGEPYVREEVLAQKFSSLLAGLQFDDEAFALIQRALKESQRDKVHEREKAVARIKAEHDRLDARMQAMYADKLDGKITEDFYLRLQAAWREERQRCLNDLARLDEADDEYIDAGLTILKFAREAETAFRTLDATRTRNLLKFLLSNCTWAAGELTAKFAEPFDLIAETVAFRPQPAPPSGDRNCTRKAKTENWQALGESNPSFQVENLTS